MPNTCKWGGYDFEFWKLQILDSFSGVYIYTRLVDNTHYLVYVGKSEDVGQRMQEHNRDDPLIWDSSDHIHGVKVDEKRLREQIECELIASYNPPLNILHRTGPAAPEITRIIPDRWRPQSR